MPFEIDPRVDFAFKRLFGVEANKPLLIDLLNAVLHSPPGREVVDVVLRDPFNLKEFAGDKLSIVDVKARDVAGRRFIVEMQMVGYPDLLKRYLYYWCDAYREQLVSAASYSQLEPVVLIAFVCEPPFPESPEHHHVFRLRDDRNTLVFSEDIELRIIELSKLTAPPGAASDKLDRWSWFFQFAKGHEMAHFLQEMLDDPIFQQAFRELQKMANNPAEREAYQKRLRDISDENARRTSYLRQGREEGREEGRIQERTAALRREIRLFERLLHLPAITEERLQSMTPAELEECAAELDRRSLSEANGAGPN